jgi:hypothetical protein
MTRRLALGLVAWAVLAGPSNLLAQDRTLEDRLKAAVVSKVPQFVRWPAAAVDGRPSFDVCIAKSDPFGPTLDELIGGNVMDGRPLAVRRVEREQDIDGCHVLFLSASTVAARPAFVQRAARLPILTVSDDARFLDKGGIIRLRLVDGHMRFDVNLVAAQHAGLQISSQFLQLALTVRGTQS